MFVRYLCWSPVSYEHLRCTSVRCATYAAYAADYVARRTYFVVAYLLRCTLAASVHLGALQGPLSAHTLRELRATSTLAAYVVSLLAAYAHCCCAYAARELTTPSELFALSQRTRTSCARTLRVARSFVRRSEPCSVGPHARTLRELREETSFFGLFLSSRSIRACWGHRATQGASPPKEPSAYGQQVGLSLR